MASGALSLLRPVPYVITDWLTVRIAALISKNLRNLRREFKDEVTQEFLELLLNSMGLFFYICKDYRRNAKDFYGRYVFEFGSSGSGNMITTATIKNYDMDVSEKEPDDWDVRIRFESADALNEFLFSRDQDIVNSMLKNEVSVNGNLNYVNKFGFLARDLTRRLGIMQP